MNKDLVNKHLFVSNYLTTIINNEKAFLYHKVTGKKLITNINTIKILNTIKRYGRINSLSNNINYINLLNNMYDKGFLLLDKNDDGDCKLFRDMYNSRVKEGIHLRNLRLNVTERCNLCCDYCYESSSSKYAGNNNMTWDVAKKSLEVFKSILLKNNNKTCTIRFFGGEPILNWEIVENALDYSKSLFPEEIKVNYVINTNGTIMTKKIADKLAENNVTVVISMDGLKEDHDMARKYKNGNGSFCAIEKNLEYVAASNCNTNLAIVCTDYNYPNLNDFIEYIKFKQDQLNHKFNICFSNVHISDDSEFVSLDTEQRVEYIMKAIRYAKKLGINCYGGLAYQVYDNMIKPNGGRHCACLGTEFSVATSGDVYPCDGLDIKLGNIDDSDSIFCSNQYISLVNRVSGNISSCSNCEIEAYCAGGCYTDYLSSNGKSPNTNRNCELEIRMFQELVKEYLL